MVETRKTAERRVFTIIANIPEGRVASYGQIARIAGIPNHARLVGKIMSQLPPNTSLPWHRVVSSRGRINHPAANRQQKRLEGEGIKLANGRISLRLYGWEPRWTLDK